MHKHLILLVIDSVTEEQTVASSFKHSPMPFLDKLKESSFQATQVYSQAPFTEAAIMPLLTGNNLLDNGGYLNKFKYRDNFLTHLSKQGYQTYLNHLQPLVYPSYCISDLIDYKYDLYYCMRQMWDYRLKYYAPYYLDGTISKEEMDYVLDVVEDNLKFAIKQLNQCIQNDPKATFLNTFSQVDAPANLEFVKKEYELFIKDRSSYLRDLFTSGESFRLFQLPVLTLNKKVPDNFVDIFINRYQHVFKRIDTLNKQKNLRNLKFPFYKSTSHLLKGEFYLAKQYIAMYKNCVIDKDLMERVSPQYPQFKASISMRSHLDDALEWLENHDSDPCALYVHIDDAHSPEIFYSVDSTNLEVLDEEFKAIEDYLNHLPKNYYGNLCSDLSLVYCDLCLKYFFTQLQKKGLLDHTVVAITADHGFSYSYRPIRPVYVNSEYTENYHIPFVLYDSERCKKIQNGYFSSKDVVPTLLESVGLPIPSVMSGMSMLSNAGRQYTTVEYLGGGCPDMERRSVILGVHTDCFLVIMKQPLNQVFDRHQLDQVYDLKKDPQQYKNLAKTIALSQIESEISLIEKRFYEIKENYEVFKREQS